ncbi:MAG: hypothetical protein H0T80_11930 [Betaproteobacteria bacterium]|nr:hypothetical protein [Betaproteobacteria bacterium]
MRLEQRDCVAADRFRLTIAAGADQAAHLPAQVLALPQRIAERIPQVRGAPTCVDRAVHVANAVALHRLFFEKLGAFRLRQRVGMAKCPPEMRHRFAMRAQTHRAAARGRRVFQHRGVVARLLRMVGQPRQRIGCERG